MRERSTSYCHFGRKPLIQLAAAQSWTLTFVRVTNEGEVHLLSSFRRKPESSLQAPKLDPDFRQGDEEIKGRGRISLLTTFLGVCIWSASAPEGGGHREASPLQVRYVEQLPSVPGSPRHLGRYGWRWERCRASAFCPPVGGRQTHSVNPSKLTEVGT